MSNQYSVFTEKDVPVTMTDGTVLRANIYRPEQEGKWPVLLTRLPYGKDEPYNPLFFHNVVRAVQRGYVVVVQDTRGRFASEGEWDVLRTSQYERSDTRDTIEWVINQPYSNGQVGMFGISYYAYTQWTGMLQQLQALKAAAPAFSWSNPDDGLISRGGALEWGFLVYWQMSMQVDTISRLYTDEKRRSDAMSRLLGDTEQLKTKIHSLPIKEFAPMIDHKVAPSFFEYIGNGLESKEIDHLSLQGKYDRIHTPTLNFTGWYDIFLAGTIENFLQTRTQGGSPKARQSKLIIGPWQHLEYGRQAGVIDFGENADAVTADMEGLHLRWFDHFLKGKETAITDEAPIRLFVMGENVWRDEYEWPLARTQFTEYYLHSEGQANTQEGDGRLNTTPPQQEPSDYFVYDPLSPVPTVGGSIFMLPDFPGGAFDQREIESREDVLVYTSPVLEEDVELTGPVKVKLWAVSSACDTDFVARLVDVYPDGTAINLTDGMIRARYRNGLEEEPSLIEPGKPYLYEIDLWATSNLFKKGHRIRLDITSSSFPRWDRNPNTGHHFGVDRKEDVVVAKQMILHDQEHPSSIVLPIIPR